MPRRRKKSLKYGSAKDKPVVWHYEHRSKKNKRPISASTQELIRLYKQKKLRILVAEMDKEAKESLKKKDG